MRTVEGVMKEVAPMMETMQAVDTDYISFTCGFVEVELVDGHLECVVGGLASKPLEHQLARLMVSAMNQPPDNELEE